MKVFQLNLRRDGQGKLITNGCWKGTGLRGPSAVPEPAFANLYAHPLAKDLAERIGHYGFFEWCCEVFEGVFHRDSVARAEWDREMVTAVDSAERCLLEFRVPDDQLAIFAWHLETMIGTVGSNPQCFYPVGRQPSSVDVARRLPGLNTTKRICQPLNSSASWNVAIIWVPSTDYLATAVKKLEALLRKLAELRNFELLDTLEFNGRNADEITNTLIRKRVHLVEIVAHAKDRSHVCFQDGRTPWEPLVEGLGKISTLQAVLLSWCWSDFFVVGSKAPASILCQEGIPAVLVWYPGFCLEELTAFHRGFYPALSRGAHLIRAASIARSMILNSVFPSKWIGAFAPRVYLHPDIEVDRIEKLAFPCPPLVRTGRVP